MANGPKFRKVEISLKNGGLSLRTRDCFLIDCFQDSGVQILASCFITFRLINGVFGHDDGSQTWLESFCPKSLDYFWTKSLKLALRNVSFLVAQI